MSKFRNKYRIESTRLKDWDYSTAWWYYVTINTKNHNEWFGKVANKKVILSEIGKVVEKEWLKTEQIRKNVELDYYIIMPNHFHGIIIIGEDVETRRGVSLQHSNNTERKFGKVPSNSLSTIINHFKGAVTRWCNKNGYTDFEWQPRFYDRIIRNDMELYKIRNYIEQNPLRWEIDKDSPENLEL